jgi:hypothetical protein
MSPRQSILLSPLRVSVSAFARTACLAAGLVMTRPFGWLALSLLLGPAGLAMAQSCPSGIPSAGNPMCLPPGAAGSPYNSSSAPPATPSMRWKKTWGAFASDDAAAVVGTSVGQFTRRAARREALAKCASMGGKDCKVTLIYENQCAVIADPVEENIQPRFGAEVGGPTVEAASQRALQICAEKNNGHACEIIHSDCTPPVLVYD